MESKNEVDCVLINQSNEPILSQVEKTYTDSFPIEERRAFPLLKELIDANLRFKLYVINREDKYAGFITVWDFDTFCYIEHFAIDSAARNGGIGGKTIECIKKTVSKPIVLEVELPTDDLSKRRISFYERLGFCLDAHIYFQPPYHEGEVELEMRLMSTGGIDLTKDFEQIKGILYKYVYQVV